MIVELTRTIIPPVLTVPPIEANNPAMKRPSARLKSRSLVCIWYEVKSQSGIIESNVHVWGVCSHLVDGFKNSEVCLGSQTFRSRHYIQVKTPTSRNIQNEWNLLFCSSDGMFEHKIYSYYFNHILTNDLYIFLCVRSFLFFKYYWIITCWRKAYISWNST